MTQEKTVVIITLSAYFLVLACTIYYAYYYLPMLNTGDWIQLSLLLVALGVFMLEGLGQILKALRRPKLKIVGSKVERVNKDTEGEHKDVYLMVRNVGGDQATDWQIMAEVEGVTRNAYYITHETFSLSTFPDKPILFQRIIKNTKETQSINHNPIPEMGKTYNCRIWFCGGNLDKSSQRLTLDLRSWDDIGVRLDC